ncbi:hypothetical protein P167DRAFT_74831 [Morchella conica CCBAS932]|uniref:Clr5 domain-containing protein n=1 Tax=Morchella conica CCBAS932 TaxID=1392247 RepID=A0A3N4KXF8_9PEZI|nr:hypothetical protein P167DRAFT_74831 [Morchella conica CCBAS932]
MPMPKFTTASGPGRTKRINWSPHVQHLIRKFYLDEGVTLDNLPQLMWEHGFRASRRSYCSKLREWGWRRKKKESSLIAQLSPSPEPIIEEKDPMEDLDRVPVLNDEIIYIMKVANS